MAPQANSPSPSPMPPPSPPPPPPSLLLLPPPPTPSTRLALNSSYHAPLSAVLSALATQSRQERRPVLLLVAVAAPVLRRGPQQPPRAVVRWQSAQSLLAGVYAVIAALCAEQGIQTDLGSAATAAAASVDARVVLVDHARGRAYDRKGDGSFQIFNGTTVPDLAGFATTVTGPWGSIFHPSSEAGYELLRAYLALAEGRQVVRQGQIVSVPGGISISTPSAAAAAATEAAAATFEDEGQDKSYETVILGGTFDHLHPGHKLLLHGTVLLMRLPERQAPPAEQRSSTLIIGVSGDPMLQSKKFADELEPWDTRCRSVLAFLASTMHVSPPSAGTAGAPPTRYRVERVGEGPSGGPELHGTYADGAVLVRCTVLNDPFGPTVDEEPIGAICVSGETRGGGKAVNDKRAAKGWHALDAYEVDVLDTRGIVPETEDVGEDFTAKISSTAIRQQKAEARAKAKAQI